MVAWLSESGFAGFFLDFRDGGCLRSHALLDGRLLALYESSLEFARVCGMSESGFAGFSWIFRMAGVFGRGRSVTSVCECCTRVYKSSREFERVCGLSESGFAGFFWIFGMAGVSGRGLGWVDLC